MEQQIVKIPQHEIVIAFVGAKAIAVAGLYPEKDLAIQQQRENLGTGKAVLPSELVDGLRRRQQREGCGNFRVTNPKQRARAGRLQNHLVAASPQIGESRQHDPIRAAEFRRSRPIIRHLRFDDDLVVFLVPKFFGPKFLAGPSRYSKRPRRANRRTSTSTSFSTALRPDSNDFSGRPVRNCCARKAAAPLNFPSSTE